MTPREAAAILRKYNDWFHDRVDDRDLPIQESFNAALDIAAKYIEENENDH